MRRQHDRCGFTIECSSECTTHVEVLIKHLASTFPVAVFFRGMVKKLAIALSNLSQFLKKHPKFSSALSAWLTVLYLKVLLLELSEYKGSEVEIPLSTMFVLMEESILFHLLHSAC